MPNFPVEVEYSEKYYDQDYEYRHVLLNEKRYQQLKSLGVGRLLSEEEWRSLGL